MEIENVRECWAELVGDEVTESDTVVLFSRKRVGSKYSHSWVWRLVAVIRAADQRVNIDFGYIESPEILIIYFVNQRRKHERTHYMIMGELIDYYVYGERELRMFVEGRESWVGQ